MNPGIAKDVAAQHHQCLLLEAAQSRRTAARSRSRGFPRHRLGWHVSWSRAILSAEAGQRRGSSLVIVISARRLPVDG
jgi:hypothetical protein